MTARVTVSERDLRTLLGIVSDHRSDLPPAGTAAIPAGRAERPDPLRRAAIPRARHRLGRPMVRPGRPGRTTRRGVSTRSCTGSSTGIRLLLPRPHRRCAQRDETIGLLLGAAMAQHRHVHRIVPARGAGARTAAVPARRAPAHPAPGLSRGPGPDFSERDRALLGLLRPHLHQAYLDAERRRHPAPQLTARQRELLRLVAAGHTNRQLARQLGISEGTVRTHLENIYATLQVSSRTAAVTRAFPGRAAGSQTP